MPKFDTMLAGKTCKVLYIVKLDETLRIISISNHSFKNTRGGQVRAVLTRIRKECMQHHEGTLFAWQRDLKSKQPSRVRR